MKTMLPHRAMALDGPLLLHLLGLLHLFNSLPANRLQVILIELLELL